MTDVRQAISIGNEQLEAPAAELACGILKKTAGLIVGEQDDARLTHKESGVRSLREDAL